jgi:hypothetical protein
MTALVWPPCTTEVTDGLCVFPYFAVPHSIIRYQLYIRHACAEAHIHLYTQVWIQEVGVWVRGHNDVKAICNGIVWYRIL